MCYSEVWCHVQDPSAVDTKWTLMLPLQLRLYLLWRPTQREESVRRSGSSWLTSVISVWAENEKVLVVTEVGAKEEKEADQWGGKGPGRAEWGLQKTDEESEKKLLLLLSNLKLSSVKLVWAETLFICIRNCYYVFIDKSYGHKDLEQSSCKPCL